MFAARLKAATDARDGSNPVFDEALKAGDYDVLVMLGQVGGDACRRLVPYFTLPIPDARKAAFTGAAFCQDAGLAPDLLAVPAPKDDAVYESYMHALGFSGGKAALQPLVTEVNAITAQTSAVRATAALYGLMQAIVYDHMEAAHLSSLNFSHVLSLATGGDEGAAAAYLLTRFRGLDQVLGVEAVTAAAQKADAEVQPLLVRVLGQFGDKAAAALREFADSKVRAARFEAVRAMAGLTDAGTGAYLLAHAAKDDIFVRQLALAALGHRAVADKAADAFVRKAVTDDNRWLRATALEGLAGLDQAAANTVAEGWLAGDDYYLAYKAMGALNRTDGGKQILQAYADAHPDTIRGHDAAVWLDPSIEGDVTARPTPDDQIVRSYLGRDLLLETNRGDICISFSNRTPYAATNFRRLADAGKMDHMLWHRVLPGFVAQAGAVEDPEINKWGSIREEWFVSDHRPGTVGLATAGKDTGGTQFFINTAYNLHLDGRYTVFGHVIKGMDVAYRLEEGDVINRASTVRPMDPQCH